MLRILESERFEIQPNKDLTLSVTPGSFSGAWWCIAGILFCDQDQTRTKPLCSRGSTSIGIVWAETICLSAGLPCFQPEKWTYPCGKDTTSSGGPCPKWGENLTAEILVGIRVRVALIELRLCSTGRTEAETEGLDAKSVAPYRLASLDHNPHLEVRERLSH